MTVLLGLIEVLAFIVHVLSLARNFDCSFCDTYVYHEIYSAQQVRSIRGVFKSQATRSLPPRSRLSYNSELGPWVRSGLLSPAVFTFLIREAELPYNSKGGSEIPLWSGVLLPEKNLQGTVVPWPRFCELCLLTGHDMSYTVNIVDDGAIITDSRAVYVDTLLRIAPIRVLV